MNCFICRKPLYEVGISKGYQILKCRNCGLGITNKGKIQKGSYHRDETYIEEEDLFKNIFEKRVNIISKFKRKGKALEVGCSTGLMLSFLKRTGWEVMGVEVSESAAKVAGQRGISITTNPFEKAKFSNKFDLIILNHTFEHLKNPTAVLEKAASLLNKDGLFYIDLPNFGSLSALIYGTRWPMLLPEEHLWHFSLKSLKILLEKLDFEIIFTERSSGIWDYEHPFKGILISLVHLKKRFFMEILTAIPAWTVWKMEMGSDLMIIAKKR